MGQKFVREALPPFLGRVEWGPHLTQSLGLRPSSIPSGILIYAANWPQQIWAEIWLGAVPLWGRGSWVPIQHNVARAEAYPHVMFHLGPSTVDERRRQTDRQWINSIGQTVLQTVAQKECQNMERCVILSLFRTEIIYTKITITKKPKRWSNKLRVYATEVIH